jgi:hypothetical protein
MKRRVPVGVRTVLAVLCVLAAVGFLAMERPGRARFTSVGVDSDHRVAGGALWETQFRIQWPGNGSVRFGAHGCPEGGHAPQFFDWGGVFFKPPGWEGPRVPGAGRDTYGFYVIAADRPDEWDRWVGMPAWFPAVPLSVLAVLLALRRSSGRGGRG